MRKMRAKRLTTIELKTKDPENLAILGNGSEVME